VIGSKSYERCTELAQILKAVKKERWTSKLPKALCTVLAQILFGMQSMQIATNLNLQVNVNNNKFE
jgi:hypothetical protein